jgi:hypothetical protein
MATIKAVKTITLTDSLSAYKVVSAPPSFGLQTEKINVTDLTNENRMEFVARPQLEETDITLMCDYSGTLITAGGAAATLTITAVDTAGVSYAKSITGFVVSAIPQSVDIGGERRMLQEVVFAPDGSNT